MKYFIFLLFATISMQVFACSCRSDAKSFDEELQKYDAIFAATAIKTDKVSGDWSSAFYQTEMKVHKVWRNRDVPRILFVKTNIESNSCGGPAPTIGNKFLIFAHISSNGLYVTGGCSLFIDLDQVDSDIDKISAEEQADWESWWVEMWSALGEPIVVYNKI
ncbi:hypothetical protein [Arsukibacterium sp.]|uniref:hypothetical protein n=1 Tax=Arsukibacterium sp. TaxID=1977258 RepID=UPI001BD58EC6|nr:hypothetical protein [Arsukibacterium sp.]